MVISQSRPPSRRGKKQRQEPCFEQHAVGLITGKILGRADEGEKADKQTSSMARGHKFMVSSSEAARPAQQIPMTMCEPLPSHSRVGANQTRTHGPNDRATASRYLSAGKMPAGPMRPRI